MFIAYPHQLWQTNSQKDKLSVSKSAWKLDACEFSLLFLFYFSQWTEQIFTWIFFPHVFQYQLTQWETKISFMELFIH